ncbi:MAG: thioredoxin family protein [Pseudomonadota bacterium]
MILRIAFVLSFVLAALAPGLAAAAGASAQTERIKAELFTEHKAVAPGETVWFALELDIIDGWHTYWRNPGDSGEPVRIAWRLPEGWSVGDILWPTPERIDVGPLSNYGHHGAPVFLVPITLPEDAPLGDVPVEADATWLVCADICVPEDASFAMSLPVAATSAVDEARAAAFQAARAALPEPAAWEARLHGEAGAIVLTVSAPTIAAGVQSGDITGAEFFAYDEGLVEHAAPQAFRAGADGISLMLQPGFTADLDALAASDGVLVLARKKDGGPVRQGFIVSASPGAVAGDFAAFAPAGSVDHAGDGVPAAPGAETGVVAVLGFLAAAFVGGLILNLMPCVFPVLFVKALGFANKAHAAPGAVRRHGLVFTAGVVLSFLLLASVFLTLRAGGAEIGWGFQLQSPLVVTALAYLFFLIGLNLVGVFEIGGGAAGAGQSLTEKGGDAGAFFTGVLAVIAATPCTAPFMAAALGFALTQPAALALGVFVALGLGLAAPFLALSFAPGLLKLLPKPGPWMVRLRQGFAFPMFAVSVWLVWVLSRQAGPDPTALALAGLVALAFAAWAFGAVQGTNGISALVGRGAALLSAGLAALLAGQVMGVPPAVATAVVQPPKVETYGVVQADFSPEKLADLKASGTPVFIDFTAAWCVTCQVNKLTVLHKPAVLEAFADNNVVFMTADWTNRDPEITAILSEYGRAGVPFYLFYRADGAAEILPTVLTQSAVIAAVKGV